MRKPAMSHGHFSMKERKIIAVMQAGSKIPWSTFLKERLISSGAFCRREPLETPKEPLAVQAVGASIHPACTASGSFKENEYQQRTLGSKQKPENLFVSNY